MSLTERQRGGFVREAGKQTQNGASGPLSQPQKLWRVQVSRQRDDSLDYGD